MITGFNTDVEYGGVVYHVQTEDKGLDSPIILSLVYSGGAILASKRSSYEDLIVAGFSDEILAERLKRQHRLICAAIHTGRIDELKKMGARGLETPETKPRAPSPPSEAFEIEHTPPTPQSVAPVVEVTETPEPQEEVAWGPEQAEPYTVYEPGREAPVPDSVQTEGGLILTLLDEDELFSGDRRILRVLVSHRVGDNDKPLGNVSVSVKILGTTFRPLIYSLKTERDGVASVSTEIPRFTSGRAAVLVKVTAKGSEAELRRVIHPGG